MRRPSPELPIVAQAFVSTGWLPTKYYFVSTIFNDIATRSSEDGEVGALLRQLDPDLHDFYITNVYECDRDYTILNQNEFLYARGYESLEHAQQGHEDVLELLQEGELPLKRQSHWSVGEYRLDLPKSR
jgi:hypothetical protein